MSAPVIIAGAGPCGLTAALTLQRHAKTPFIIIERAQRAQLFADVGSGYDLSGTTLSIFRHLGFEMDDSFSKRYQGYVQYRMDNCAEIRQMGLADLPAEVEFRSAPRSDIQTLLLGALGNSIDLRCGVGVKGFRETTDGVVVSLSDGSEVQGCALLACDGVKSAVRAFLYANVADKLTYRGTDVWWGRAPFPAGSRLAELMRATQFRSGKCIVQYMGVGRAPGSFFVTPHKDVAVWAFTRAMPEAAAPSACGDGCMAFMRPSKAGAAEPSAASSGEGEDLTRRGGVSGAETKTHLASLVGASSGYRENELIRLVIDGTPPDKLTRVGLVDRGEGLDLPYLSAGGRVALLGDAAHPQEPWLGQGCNTAVADAFVCATRLSCQPAVDALRGYASEERRRGTKALVLEARKYGHMFTSSSSVMCSLVNAFARWAPVSMLIGDISTKDATNKDFVQAMLSELGLQM